MLGLHKEPDVVGGHRVVEHAPATALRCLKEPLREPPAVSGKPEK